ncbi:TMEM175 family protein [Naasia sp. SYSU D00948]|uniref:TMEM175 family protein n=1 Tax=Naasia sp. SYSU D00948 TaxID=2817379 RepID=UPI001B30FA3B|nr:TMEM175 family protein [Naasia sp. SYSU D00948]
MSASIDRDRDPLEFARVLSLSDAIFGVAMTLLVISIVVPPGLSSREFPAALGDLVPRIAIFALSIAIAASAWVDHRRLFGLVQRIDTGLLVRNFVLLGLVALIPLPHQVLGDYPHEPLAYVLYALVLGSVSGLTAAMQLHVRRRGLLRAPDAEPTLRLEVTRGLLIAAGFVLSIPLAFVLGPWTPIVWFALLPLDRLLVLRAVRSGQGRRRAPSSG